MERVSCPKRFSRPSRSFGPTTHSATKKQQKKKNGTIPCNLFTRLTASGPHRARSPPWKSKKHTKKKTLLILVLIERQLIQTSIRHRHRSPRADVCLRGDVYLDLIVYVRLWSRRVSPVQKNLKIQEIGKIRKNHNKPNKTTKLTHRLGGRGGRRHIFCLKFWTIAHLIW